MTTVRDAKAEVLAIGTMEDAEAWILREATILAVRLPLEEAIARVRSNVGYLTGYMDTPDRLRVMALFSTEHPIFGTFLPTLEQAFRCGELCGQAMRDGSRSAEAMAGARAWFFNERIRIKTP